MSLVIPSRARDLGFCSYIPEAKFEIALKERGFSRAIKDSYQALPHTARKNPRLREIGKGTTSVVPLSLENASALQRLR